MNAVFKRRLYLHINSCYLMNSVFKCRLYLHIISCYLLYAVFKCRLYIHINSCYLLYAVFKCRLESNIQLGICLTSRRREAITVDVDVLVVMGQTQGLYMGGYGFTGLGGVVIYNLVGC